MGSGMQLFESVSRWFAVNPVVRRVRARARVSVDEQVLVRVAEEAEISVALLRDIAHGGACIRTDMRLHKGDPIWLRVDGGASGSFEATAVVVSSRPHPAGFFSDYGLRLVKLDIDSANKLGSFINSRLASQNAR